MMRRFAILLGLLGLSMSSPLQSSPTGIIGRLYEGEFAVIYKLDTAIPAKALQESLPVLAIVTWSYDGSANEGMPSEEDLQRMKLLEKLIGQQPWPSDSVRWVYSRTGNGRKELVYYAAREDSFLEGFNVALEGESRFPIEIEFFEDPAWEDVKRLSRAFRNEG